MSDLTAKAICDTLVKRLNKYPLDKITVKEIISDCGISRNTFYYHYHDIYDVLADVFKRELDSITLVHTDYDSWQEAFTDAITFTRENKRAIYNIYYSVRRDTLEDYLYALTDDIMLGYVKEQAQGMNVTENDIRVISDFYKFALSGFCFEWIKNEMKSDALEKIKEIGNIFEGNIKVLLEKCSKNK